MLSLMRKHAGSWIIKFILGAVILAFIPFGYGLYRDKREGQVVASVDGESISYSDYRRIFNNLLDQMRQSFGTALDDEMIKSLGIKDRALNQLIESKLMLAEARRLKFRVSDAEVADAIGKIEVFQTGGVFDRRRYEYILDRNRITTEQFEMQQKESMLINKVRSIILNNLTVSDAEAIAWYNWQNASVDLDFVLFNPVNYKSIETDAQEIETYYEKNKSSYKKEAEVKVRYVFFDPAAHQSAIVVDAEESQDYYDTHKEEFSTPKTVEARHILIKVDRNADAGTVEAAKAKALDILEKAREGTDFAELAKQYSEGPTKVKGGHLGSFKHEDMVKPFSDKAFSMSPGEISDLVRTQFGWHIIKVEKINEASTLSFDKAKPDIQKKITTEKARSIAYDAAEAVYEESFEGDDLINSASKRNLQVLTTEFFTRRNPIKGIKNPAKFASVAFGLEVMEISEIQELNEGYYILQVIEKIPEKIAEFKDVRDKVKADLIGEKKEEKAREDAQALLQALQSGESFTTVSAKYNLKPETTGFFTRNGTIPKIGYERAVSASAFMLSKEKSLPEKPVKGQKGYYLIRFKSRKNPSEAGFDKEKKAIKQKLMQQKTFQTLNAWLAALRSNSDIAIQEGFSE
jgi:peptidyl-prolyl cis-trans isomerase D